MNSLKLLALGLGIGVIMAQDSVTVFTKYYPASSPYTIRASLGKLRILDDSSLITIGGGGNSSYVYALHISSSGTPLHFHRFKMPTSMLVRFYTDQTNDVLLFEKEGGGYVARLQVDPVAGFDTLWQKRYEYATTGISLIFSEHATTLKWQDKIYTVSIVGLFIGSRPMVLVLDTNGNVLNGWVDINATNNNGAQGGGVYIHPDGDLLLLYRIDLGKYVIVKVAADFQQIKWAREITDEAFPNLGINPYNGDIWVASAGWGSVLDIIVFRQDGSLKIQKGYGVNHSGHIVKKVMFLDDKHVLIMTQNTVFLLNTNDASIERVVNIPPNNTNYNVAIADVAVTPDSGLVFLASDAKLRFTVVKINKYLDDGVCNWVDTTRSSVENIASISIYTPNFVDSSSNISIADIPFGSVDQLLPLDSSYCPLTQISNEPPIVNVLMPYDTNNSIAHVLLNDNIIYIEPILKGVDNVNVSIFDLSGRTLVNKNIYHPIYISLLKGIYIIRLSNGQHRKHMKIIIK